MKKQAVSIVTLTLLILALVVGQGLAQGQGGGVQTRTQTQSGLYLESCPDEPLEVNVRVMVQRDLEQAGGQRLRGQAKTMAHR